MTESLLGRWGLLALGVVVEGGLGLVALGLGWLLGRPALGTWRADAIAIGLGLLATFPMLAALFACLRWPTGPLRQIRDFTDAMIRPLFRDSGLVDFAVLSLLAGIGEELLFRGVLQEATSAWFGPVAGVALAAVAFGLCHALTPTYTVFAALLGAYLGLLQVWSGNLVVPVVAHAAYDFVALAVITRPQPPES